MHRKFYIVPILLLVAGGLLFALYAVRNQKASSPEREAIASMGTIDWHIAANGRTEGASEELKLGSKIPGRIRAIYVEEGDRIRKGQVLAVLENDDYLARLEMAKAELAKAEARLERLLKGARREEIDEAQAAVAEAQAVAENARTTYERIRQLSERGVVPRHELDQAEKNWKAAEARLESARQRYNLIVAPPRPEDVAAARADVAMARARVSEAQVNYDNSFIRSPVDGIVLRKYMGPGETITFQALSMPILSVADNSKIMVRAEIDETDVAKVRAGQRALVTADAYPDRTFVGRLVRIGGAIGKKQVKTDSPFEKIDTEVLEALIELEPGTDIKLGLRVKVIVQIAYKENALIVPRRAVHHKADGFYVRVKRSNSWIERKVTLGVRDEENIEILSGLKAGDVVLY